MNNYSSELIPVDSLVIARSIKTESRYALQEVVNLAIKDTGLVGHTSYIGIERHVSATILSDFEYASKRILHPRLALYSVGRMALQFNNEAERRADIINDNVDDVALGGVEYDDTSDGMYQVGCLLGNSTRQRIMGDERSMSIDTILDTAGVTSADSIRDWKYEESGPLWVPLVKIKTKNASEENLLDDFCEALDDRAVELKIEFLAAKAKKCIVDIPI